MAINFTIGDLTNDQTAGVQTPSDGNDIDVTLDGSSNLTGVSAGFKTFLSGLGLTSDQKNFAVNVDAASSSNLIQVSATAGETINDLKLIADSTSATGWTTLTNQPLYLHVDATGNYATLTTATGTGGTIVAAFALTNEVINNATHTATAGVQMITFAPINHPIATNPDDTLALGNVLQVGVDTAVSFDFHQLAAGNFLWAAVGNSSSAMLITGQDLDVNDTAGTKQGTIVKGGSDPSDAVNTSKATETTIGINAQHFAPKTSGDGSTGVFTFVTGFDQLALSTPNYTGQNVKQITYDNYINTSSASVFISQLTGGSTAKIHFSLFEAGGGDNTDHATADLLPEQGYGGQNSTNPYTYIGNQLTDSNLKDDTEVNVATVTIGAFTWTYNGATNGTKQGNITVTINGNDVTVDGATANDLITFTAVDGASSLDGTFNRIDIQALAGSASFDIGHIDLSSGGTTAAGLGSHLFADDDGPTITDSIDGNDLLVSNKLATDDPSGHAESQYTIDAGTDGLKSFTFVGTEDTVGLFQWTYDNPSHTSITGTYDGHDLYTLALHSDGTYDFDMTGVLPGSTLDLNPAEVIKAGAPDAPILQIGAKQNDDYVQMSADSTVGKGYINESNGVVGVDNGNIDIGESITFTLHEANADVITFQGIQIGTKSAKESTYSFTAHIVGGGTVSGTETVSKDGTIIIDASDLQGATVDSITIMKVSGPATKIGVSDIHIIIEPDDALLSFDVQALDGDNDPASASFTVAIDGNNDGNYDATANSSAVIANATSNTSKWSGVPITSNHIDLHASNSLFETIHHYHADYALI